MGCDHLDGWCVDGGGMAWGWDGMEEVCVCESAPLGDVGGWLWGVVRRSLSRKNTAPN